MTFPRLVLLASLVSFGLAVATHWAEARDWVFQPSTFSHSLKDGHRINQFATPPPVYLPQRPDYRRSGFHQSRTSINVGGSSDQYHVVERWGENIRPYGEWLYPNRPYAVPYDAWGPPFGGVNEDFRRRGAVPNFFGGPFGGGFFPGPGVGGGDDVELPATRGRARVDARARGLFDGREIPGDDQHYLERRSNLDRLNDRQFYRNPRDFPPPPAIP